MPFFEVIMKYTHVIWDFNGTIFDDLMPSINSTNKMLRERNIPEFASVDDYRRAFGFPVKDYYEHIGFDFSKWRYEDLAVEWLELYLESTKNSGLMPGVKKAILKFDALGLKQTVLSACESGILKEQLHALGVDGYFCEIIGLDNIHAGGKSELAHIWRKENVSATAAFIGDTVHDAEVADIIGADCYLYLGGHQDRARLEKCGQVFEDFSEAVKMIVQA